MIGVFWLKKNGFILLKFLSETKFKVQIKANEKFNIYSQKI